MIFSSKKKTEIDETLLQVPLFGYDLLRDDLLPDLLGKEHTTILYWGGKSLARKYPLATIEDIIAFFSRAGWGHLQLVNEKKAELLFQLTSDLFEHKTTIERPLEAGFLAEQIQNIKGCMTETSEEWKKGTPKKVLFLVKWDVHDLHNM